MKRPRSWLSYLLDLFPAGPPDVKSPKLWLHLLVLTPYNPFFFPLYHLWHSILPFALDNRVNDCVQPFLIRAFGVCAYLRFLRPAWFGLQRCLFANFCRTEVDYLDFHGALHAGTGAGASRDSRAHEPRDENEATSTRARTEDAVRRWLTFYLGQTTSPTGEYPGTDAAIEDAGGPDTPKKNSKIRSGPRPPPTYPRRLRSVHFLGKKKPAHVRLRVCIVSDTHGFHPEIPSGHDIDVVLHCGDFFYDSRLFCLRDAKESKAVTAIKQKTIAHVDHWWQNEVRKRVLMSWGAAVAIAGNHDAILAENNDELAKRIFDQRQLNLSWLSYEKLNLKLALHDSWGTIPQRQPLTIYGAPCNLGTSFNRTGQDPAAWAKDWTDDTRSSNRATVRTGTTTGAAAGVAGPGSENEDTARTTSASVSSSIPPGQKSPSIPTPTSISLKKREKADILVTHCWNLEGRLNGFIRAVRPNIHCVGHRHHERGCSWVRDCDGALSLKINAANMFIGRPRIWIVDY